MGTDPQLRDLGKRDGLQVWRVNNFELEVVPAKNHGIFYAGDSYIILSTSKNASRWDVHFWLGKGSSIDEIGVATIKTIEIDQALGGFPVQHREIQDHESSLFLSHFSEGIRYLEGGYESGFNVVEDQFENWTPKLFHCKGKRNVRCTQVACKKESLNLGDVFLLDLGRDLYIWMPPESGRLERIKGMTRAKHIANVERHGHTKVHILDVDWRSDEDFWSHFGGRDVVDSIAKAKDDDENYWKRTTEQVTLWRVSDSTGHMQVKKIAQGMDVRKSLLDTKDAFILDAVEGGIFVWVGRQCTLEERAKALMWGQKYLQQQNLPAWTAVARVLETAEPSSFTQWFGDWDTEKKKGQFKPRLYQVSDESGKLVVDEIVNFNQESLDGDDVMIMDAKNIIYVWIGANANERERDEAEKTAQDYLKQGSLPRGSTCVELLHQGKENSTFKKLFKKWDDNLFKNVTTITKF